MMGIGYQVEVNGTAFDHQEIQAVAAPQRDAYSGTGFIF